MNTVELHNHKSDVLYRELRSEALRLHTGKQFRSIRELMRAYSVSQAVVDAAIAKLCSDGLLTPVKGRGLFVNHAAPLTAAKSGAILVMVPRWVSPDICDLKEMAARLSQSGERQVVCQPYDYEHVIPRNLDAVASSLAGLVILTSGGIMEADDIISLYRYERLVPTVVLGKHLDNVGLPCVGLDDEYSGMLAVKWLQEHGHSKIGVLLSEPHNSVIMKRVAACQSYVKLFSLECRVLDCEVRSGEVAETKTCLAFAEMLRRGLEVTAIVGVSGDSITGALNACHNQQVEIPKDLSIVAIAGEQKTAVSYPPIDTVPSLIGQQLEAAVRWIEHCRQPAAGAETQGPLALFLKNDLIPHGSVCPPTR